MTEETPKPPLAPLTLSIPSIASLVLQHLVSLLWPDDLPRRPAYYRALCDASLVSFVFRQAARPFFHRHLLFFDGGAKQMRNWLYAQEQLVKAGVEVNTESVILHDDLPFRLAEEGEEGEEERAKWSRPVLREVFGRMRDVKELFVGWRLAEEFPLECVLGENWKDLFELPLDCPLSPTPTNTPVPPFQLKVLRVSDTAPFLRSWFSTFAFLSPSLRGTLDHLDLSLFRRTLYEPFLAPEYLLPAAESLTILALPHLTLNSSSWRLAIFALSCVNLEDLMLEAPIYGEAISDLLPYFSSPPLKYLTLSGLEGVVGAGIVHPLLLSAKDPLVALHEVLETWPTFDEGGLECVELRDLRLRNGLGCKAMIQLLMLRPWKGFRLDWTFDERFGPDPTEEEIVLLHDLYNRHIEFLRTNFAHLSPEELASFFEKQQENLHEAAKWGDLLRDGANLTWSLPEEEALLSGGEVSEGSEEGTEEEDS